MYPRNNASPERIAVGSIYLIADGTIQTTGASVRVMPQGGAADAGAGTLDCDATSGVWHYTPSQGETNYASFMVMVYKASCTSASVTVVTTESAVAGRTSLGSILGTALTETSAGYLAAAFKKLFDVATPLLVASDAMRGTDSAALASAYTATRAGYLDELGPTNMPADLDALISSVDDVLSNLTLMAGAGFATETDSLSAIRDRGDAAWTTGAGGSAPTVEQIRAEIDSNSTQLAAILADTDELQTNQGNWVTATGFSTFDPTSDKVYLGNGAHGGVAATLTLSKFTVTCSTGDAVTFQSTGGNGQGLKCLGNGTGSGTLMVSGATCVVGGGLWVQSANAAGLYVTSTNATAGYFTSTGGGAALKLSGSSFFGTPKLIDLQIWDPVVGDYASLPGSTWDSTTDTLEDIRDNQAGADVSAIADAVWDEALAGHADAGSAGAALSAAGGGATNVTMETTETRMESS
jgi:hypothetical protein